MSLTFQPTRVGTGSDEDGMLVFFEERLVAVLVHLGEDNEIAPGQWFVEAGFGRIGLDQPLFPDLDDASAWLLDRLQAAR